jgi:hypothetical protein
MDGDVISQPGGSGTAKDATATRQSDDRYRPGFEPTQEEKDAVKVWLERINRAETNPAFKEWVDTLAELREYVAGTKHDDKTGKKLVRSNMIHATISAMMPNLYAKNPDIGVTPTDAVPSAVMGRMKSFAATAEKVLHKMLVEEGRLKKRAKANIRATCTTSVGVLKLAYQKEYRGDPLIIHRIEDAQDNLAKIEALAASLKKEDDPSRDRAEAGRAAREPQGAAVEGRGAHLQGLRHRPAEVGRLPRPRREHCRIRRVRRRPGARRSAPG